MWIFFVSSHLLQSEVLMHLCGGHRPKQKVVVSPPRSKQNVANTVAAIKLGTAMCCAVSTLE